MKKNDYYYLIVLFFVAFIIRMLTYNSIFVGDDIRFLEFDTYYHMRRAVSFADNFPHMWNFDTYIDYPYGSVTGWPPLYDWTIALISYVIGIGNSNVKLVETVGVYFPIFLGSLSVVVIYYLSKEIFEEFGDEEKGHKIGIISSFLLAIIPAFVQVSFLGFVDHHVAEVLLSSIIFLFFLKANRDRNKDKKDKDKKNKNDKNVIIFSLIAGFVLSLAIFTWLGTPIFIGIILIYIIIQSIIDKNNKDTDNADSGNKPLYLDAGFLLFLFASIFTIVLNIVIIFSEVSFLIAILLASLVIICVLRVFDRYIKKRYLYLTAIISTTIILYIGMYLFFYNIYENISLGLGYLITDRPLLQQVKEAQPLFFTFNGKFTLEPSWYAFNAALYIGIIGLVLLIIRTIKIDKTKDKTTIKANKTKEKVCKDDTKDKVIMFLVWTFIVMVLNLYQTRFIYLFAVNLAILCAYLITELIYSNKIDIKIIGAILLIVISISSFQTINDMTKYPLMLSNDWFVSMKWVKDNTPDPDDNWNMPSRDHVPNYGIMSWWDYGNYILYLSRRPVIANNFQLGAEDSANFFTSENETEANKIMNRRNARYVIVDYRLGLNFFRSKEKTYIRGSWVSAAFLSGKNLGYYLDKNNFPNGRYFNTTYAKLYLFNGKGLDNYKLLYKSPTVYSDPFGRPIEEIKIYEYVSTST